MRHAPSRRRARAAIDPLISDRDDLPAVRHRIGDSLSVGSGAALAWLDWVRPSRALHSRVVRWLCLRVEEGRARLESQVIRLTSMTQNNPELPVLTTTVEKMVQWA